MGWHSSTLGESFDVRDGTHDSPIYQDQGYPLVTSKNLKNGSLSFEKIKFISKADFEKINGRSQVHKGDVLFAMIGTIGNPVLIVEEPVFSIKNVALFKVPMNQSGKFLKYYLESPFVIEKMFKEAKGATQKFVGLGYLRNFPVSLPPIPEQQRIVAILDQAFANIEKARANAEQNLKNARELFDSYLQQVFSRRGEGWVESELGEVAEFKNGLNFSQSSKGERLRIVGVRDFKSNFLVPFDQLETIQIDDELPLSYELKENDIITVRSNGNKRLIGRCLLVGPINHKTSYSGFTIRIRITSDSVDPEFLTYYMKSASVHEMLISAGGGANISNLNQKILTYLPFFYPSNESQVQLVASIKKIEAQSNLLQMSYEKKLASLDELKKSILQKAFSGELTKSKGIAA